MTDRRSDAWEEEDDGRTIADMSGVSRRNLFGFNLPKNAPAPPNSAAQDRGNVPELTRGERMAAVWGALKATLLIGSVYAVILGAAIWLMIRFWR